MATKKTTPKTKTPRRKKAAPKKTAVKKDINKSAEIRAYLGTHKNAGPKEICGALAEKGIDVSEALVSNVKTNMAKKKATKKTVAKTATRKTAATSPVDDLKQAGDLMFQAVDLVLKAGGKEAASLVKMAVGMVEKISDENGK